MKVAISSDHGGYPLKEYLKENLKNEYELVDFGCSNTDSVDYPLYASKVAKAIENNTCELGIAICTNGIGVSIVCNKYKGIRCALCLNKEMAEHSRSHNDANCLALGAVNNTFSDSLEIAKTFLKTEFSNVERHARRVKQIKEIEEN